MPNFHRRKNPVEKLFVGDKGKYFDRYSLEDFTNDECKNIGLYNGSELNDAGRINFPKKESDPGKFQMPSLRNVAVISQFMHNGMFTKLQEVIDYFNNPAAFITDAINIDPVVQKPPGLTGT